jgi:chemotaxis protein methyltransferase CheR
MSETGLREVAELLGQRLTPQTEAAFSEALLHARAALGLSVAELLARSRAGDELVLRTLLERAVVGETYFYRHPEHFAALDDAAANAAAHGRPYRTAWSVGCSTGEEAYSLAMALAPHLRGAAPVVVGSDVSPRSLERAREGRYSAWSVRGGRAPSGLRAVGEGWEVAPEVRAAAHFSRLNLASDRVVPPAPLPTPVDVIFCRNVLVYLTAERVAAVLRALGEALAEDGLLVVNAMDAPDGVPGLQPAAADWPGLFTRSPPKPRSRPLTSRNARAAQPRPPSGHTRTAHARSLADGGDLDGALAACAALGDEPEALLLAASIHAEREELDRAGLLLRRLLLVRPDHRGGNLRLALVAARRGEQAALERARAQLLSNLAGQPDDAAFGYEDLTAGHVRQILAGLKAGAAP